MDEHRENPFEASATIAEVGGAKAAVDRFLRWQVAMVVAAIVEGVAAAHFLKHALHGAPNMLLALAFWVVPVVSLICAGFFGVMNPSSTTTSRTWRQWSLAVLAGALISIASYCCFCMTCCGSTLGSANVLSGVLKANQENTLCGICAGLALILVCVITAKISRRVFS